jgi:hypothetical protein
MIAIKKRTEDRFPYEADSPWVQDLDTKRRWSQALEDTGVRDCQGYNHFRSPWFSRVDPNRRCVFMTRGFAEQWLAWHDRKQTASDRAFRAKQIFWPKWAAIVLTISAIGGLIAWMIKYIL